MSLAISTREGKTESSAAPFGRVKGQQRLRENGLGSSRPPPITHFDPLIGAGANDLQLHPAAVAPPASVSILERFDQGLFDLTGDRTQRAFRERAGCLEAH